jgi:integrase
VELGELLDEIAGFVRRFVVMSPAQSDAAAVWVVHTHVFGAAEQTPYLAISSAEKRSGKTRLLEVLELLVARPWLTGRVTAAVLARKVDAERPTLLLDESDAAFKGDKEYAEALRGLLNTGHRRGGKSTVCVGQGGDIGYKDFSTYCPKAIAGIGKLPDTVADRSLPLRLERRAPDEKAERFRRRDAEVDALALRGPLEELAELGPRLEAARPDLPAELDDRAQDAAEPLLAIADLAGGDWPDRARRAIVELRAAASQRDAAIISVLAYAGLRPQELRGLRWGHVGKQTLVVGAPKTHSRRTVRLLAALAADLAAWRMACGRPGDDVPVFPGRDGGPWSGEGFNKWRAGRARNPKGARWGFAKALEAAGIERARPYDLRHSFASLLLHEGRSVIYVARQLGHGAEQTMRSYGHVIDELEDAPHIDAERAIRQARELPAASGADAERRAG